jgi:multiple sugar transport system substrate-binding protein
VYGCNKENQESDKVEIKFVSWYGEVYDLWMEEVIKPFEKTHPNIKVTFETVPYHLYCTKILTSSSSGAHVADLLMVDDWFAQILISSNYTNNLQPFFNRDFNNDDFIRKFLDVYRNELRGDTNLYALPLCGGCNVLFYNKNLFDENQIPYPDSNWTYDDLLSAAKIITKDTNNDGRNDIWGFICDQGIFYSLVSTIYSFDGSIFTEDYKRSNMNNPETINALRFMNDLINKYKSAKVFSNFGEPEFQTERIGMNIWGDYYKLIFKDVKFRWDIALLPKGPTGKRMSLCFSNGLCIPKTSNHPNESWELLKWIVTYPNRKKVDELFWTMLPAYKPLATSEEWLNGIPKCNRRVILEMLEKYSFTLLPPRVPEWREIGIRPFVEKMYNNQLSPEEVAKMIQDRLNQMFNSN